MARTDEDTALPEAPSKEPSRPPSGSRSTVFAWVGVLAAGAATAALAVVTFTGNDDVDVRARRLATQAEEYERQAHLEGQARTYGRDSGSTIVHSNGPAADGTAEDSGALERPPGCLWTTEVNTPVFPAEDLGAAPTPESVLTFERCNGEWTGRIAWLNPG